MSSPANRKNTPKKRGLDFWRYQSDLNYFTEMQNLTGEILHYFLIMVRVPPSILNSPAFQAIAHIFTEITHEFSA